MIPGVLIGGGFLLALLSWFPLTISDWLPRSIEFMCGLGTLVAGIGLVEVRGWIREGRE